MEIVQISKLKCLVDNEKVWKRMFSCQQLSRIHQREYVKLNAIIL